MTLFVAPTQADPCLARLCIDSEADVIITDDSDFPMYIGPNRWDIMIKDISVHIKGDPTSPWRLCTGQENITELFNKILQLEQSNIETEMFPNTLFSMALMIQWFKFWQDLFSVVIHVPKESSEMKKSKGLGIE